LGEQKAGEVGVGADSVVYLYLSLVNDPPASEPNLKLYRPKPANPPALILPARKPA